ncbi:hypothetical protein M436DRAFT_46564 [Aureobasidium namibiae CBS 147.97]|uniref:C2 NT-type domain-containing protein n=1 Tax=Aureobasidium namibiae CBS 147.97 TaxID=1043004 RepID=A0A074WUG0_9PEZI|nr:uncharacterized protein M436DRAFT_46564 [Aureobasidium namibiae CBS 147.97]KEQ73372.1 hypothetical protein M436DRAFT_46564 [Aureobasidium namibiae CBS 147.97]
MAPALSASTLTFAVPKARRPRFDFNLNIFDLNNVPLVSGTCFVKWHLPSSSAAEHRGRTNKCNIKDHKVVFDYEKQTSVRLVIGKDHMLQELYIHLEIIQEYSSAGKGERITLGNIKLNLAEYVDTNDHAHQDEEGVTRRYLMQDSKINSTLKVSLHLKHLEGDRSYYAPPLRTAPVFGGITGIMSQEVAEVAEEGSNIPSLSNKSRENGELQDMYRRTLAASWVAQPGELRADDCIKDIFAGGDGWGSHLDHVQRSQHLAPGGSDEDKAKSNNLTPTHKSNRTARSKSPMRGHQREVSKESQGTFGGRSSLHQQAIKFELESAKRKSNKLGQNEIDEFDNPWREDLRSWKIGNMI